MLKKIAVFLICLSLPLVLISCSSPKPKAESGKLNVVVTFDAMKEFALAVGGNRVAVSTIIPDGTEPHDFEPKGKDLAGLSTADVFVYNGLGMEGWAENAAKAADNAKLISVEAAKGIEPIRDSEDGKGQDDPHTWLSPKSAETEVQNICGAFDQADPANKDFYDGNAKNYIAQLEGLYQQYKTTYSLDKNKNFVTGHAAFAYLCRDFGLRQNSVEDVFALGEPSARRVAELIDYCRKNAVKTVFVEDMVSPEVSQTLASEVGAKIKVIYTMESSEDNKTYLERMKDNLNEIAESLAE